MLAEVFIASDEQEDNPLAIVVYKALPQLIPAADTVDDADKEEVPENEQEIDEDEDFFLQKKEKKCKRSKSKDRSQKNGMEEKRSKKKK
ncbi:hypothetical protein V6N13_023156 [Hibiscus sabdariffa]